MNDRELQLGLGPNLGAFALLVLINAFVGAMVGLERTVLPLLAEAEFGIASRSAALSFIATFGVVKALANAFAGRFVDRFGRKPVLTAGWLFGLPVPILVIWAPSWSWIVFANVLLGINQGLAWSTTVVMKIDLVGSRRRGLAMGLNESAGYLAVAVVALATGAIAEVYGLRPEPFYLGIGVAAIGTALTLLFVRETRGHAELEARHTAGEDTAGPRPLMRMREIVARVSWRDPALSSASQAGLVNNLNDGLVWGLFPIYFAARGIDVAGIGVLSFAYPAVWGLAQSWTGAISDRWGRKPLIAWGMLLQGIALFGVTQTSGFRMWLVTSVLLGIGTAMVYPTLLAAIGDAAHPSWRGTAIGVYRS
ncbi:MAG: MFS transporter, partial [Gemmatimonadetes bacterium]|nr:MFS transporter [Gemmatimonadota bacterium]